MDIYKEIESVDNRTIKFAKRWAMPFSRFAIFVIYFWFGALKVFSQSPANPLVLELLVKIMPGVSFESFIITFGVLEMIIGLIFIIPRFVRLAVFVLLLHLVTTIAPLFVLPEIVWQGFMSPTLEGQYIIKNILIIALAFGIFAHLHPSRVK